jgi:hypothetical protein
MTLQLDDKLVLERIDGWPRRLIDLSYRNRLIKYRPTVASTLEIEAPDIQTLLADPGRGAPWRFYFPPEPEEKQAGSDDDAATFVDELVVRAAQDAERAPRPDEIVVHEQNPRRISRTLENLARKSNAEFQDKALRILYITAGFLDWVDPTREESLTSPLILVPVELRREHVGQPYALHFVDGEEIVVNPSLTEELRRDVRPDGGPRPSGRPQFGARGKHPRGRAADARGADPRRVVANAAGRAMASSFDVSPQAIQWRLYNFGLVDDFP